MEVGGYYTRKSQDDNTVITIYKPVGDFITGGGYIIPIQSAGQYASDAGKKTNFGFNVKYGKSGNNLQGNMNFIFRRTVSEVQRVYQIKSNSMTSLGVNVSNPNAQTAQFISKCNLTDITNPLSPISLGGNLTMQVNITDRGEPGNNDDIAISLYNGSALLYSSSWTGNNTALMLLAGGNLVVHSGFSVGAANTTGQKYTTPILTIPPALEVKVLPNPTSYYFNLALKSGSKEKVTITVIDVTGRVIEQQTAAANSTLQLGNKYHPGIYIAEVRQGNDKVILRLIKEGE